MPKRHKALNDIDAPYLQSLMRLMETQSKTTLANWCISYAERYILPVYEKASPEDPRPMLALELARDWLAGRVKLPRVKRAILEVHAAARESEANPAAQAAARAIGQSASTVHSARHSIGLALYGALAVAYDRLGADADWSSLSNVAEAEVGKMEAALRTIAVENESNPATLKWSR